jgi:branched-chain amino acid transport system permease protein
MTRGRTIACGIVGLIVLLGLPKALTPHQLHVAFQVLLFGYLSYCWSILGGFAGQTSFGHALFMAVGAYTSTVLLLSFGVSPWLGMLAGGALSGLLGLFIGYLSFRYGIKGAYFGLVTVAFTEIGRIVALNVPAIGGALGLYIPIQSDSFRELKFVDKISYYYVAAGFLLLVLAVTAWLERSATGHKLTAIRENENAAQALGINVIRYKLFATGLSAFMTALGGTLYAHYVTFIDPHTLLNLNMALEITIYAIVGGVGTLFGPLIGAVFLLPLADLVRTALGQSYAGIHLVVYGAVLMAVILFVPEGLMGLLRTAFARGRARHDTRDAAAQEAVP